MKIGDSEEITELGLEELSPQELVHLAMLAFIHMHDKKVIPKDQLLEDIMTWFRLMTDDIDDLQIHEVMMGNDTVN